MDILKAVIGRIKFRIKLKRMDDMYYLMGGSCFGLFPPSFYYTHTPEEVERITNQVLEEIENLIDEYRESVRESKTDAKNMHDTL